MSVSVPSPETSGKQPPQNQEAEVSVLGSILLSEQALDGILIDVKLRADDFYRPRHGVIFGAMIRLKEKADPEPVDVLTVSDELERAGQLEEVGGREYVHSLPNLVPAAANARQYARIVKEHAMLRRLLDTTRGIQQDVFGFAGEPHELLEKAEAQLYRIAHDDRTGELRSIEAVLNDELAKLERVSREGVAITGTPSGFKDIDDLTGGFQPGNLIVLAARPAMGKCLVGSSLVYDPTTGRRRRIDELVAAHERGEEVWVASLDPAERLVPARVDCVARNGRKPIFRVVTLLGRQLDATANHPLYTPDGWRRVDELSIGQPVAAATRFPGNEARARELVGVAGATGGGLPSDERPNRVGPDIEWDEVTSVDPVGVDETYDLSVPNGRSFVADDLIVHNSALATNIAQNASVDHGRGIALFSLEMSETKLAQRFIAAEAKLNGDDLRKGRVRPDRWPKVVKATEKLYAAPMYIDDSSDLGVMEMRAKARRLHAREPLGLVIVDYLQLMRPEPGADSRVEQIGQISRGLKLLARELNIPVIAVSQLSRAVEQRPDKRPLLSDLRESGSIEQDADLVMFIYRDEYYNRESERPGEADIIVAKHRNGPIGDVTLTFLSRYPKFANMYRPPPGGGPPPPGAEGGGGFDDGGGFGGGGGSAPRGNGHGNGGNGGGADVIDLPPPPERPAGSEDDPW